MGNFCSSDSGGGGGGGGKAQLSRKHSRKGRAVADWTPADVQDYLRCLELDSLVDAFERDAVCGKDLLSLSDEDFVDHLGCSPLQVRKIRSNLPKDRPQRAPAQPRASTPYAPPVITPMAQPPFPAVPMQAPVAAPAPVAAAPPLPIAVPFNGAAAAQPALGAPPVAVPLAGAAMVAPVAAAAIPPPVSPAPPPVPAAPVPVAPAPVPAAPAAAPAPAAAAAAAPAGEARATELDRVALDLRTKAAEAQQHAGTYGQATALLQQAEGKLHGAIRSLSVTSMSSAMAVGRNIRIAAHGVRGPQRRTMMRGGPVQNMIELATVRKADAAVKSAAADISQARTLVPTIPFIQEAALQGARQGVFLGLLAPGVTTGMLQMSRVRRGLDAAERMYQQVQAARDWTMRNRQAFQRQADTLHGQAAAKQAEAQAVRSVA